ncbi:DegV family protein [Spiroplasma endosymbiont of Stenodema calcarata]|uniref:DegV family protein n=1 Tax=Spiroplasma endosymbiont of Stenodema calcarata TaxID=3139328 RepID=UPI003CCB412F
MKIAILTDSSYGTGKTYDNLYKISLPIILPDLKIIEDDKNFTDKKFLEIINKNFLKTSQTPFEKIIETLKNLLTKYDQVIICGLAKNLSGQYNQYLLATKYLELSDRIFVIDSNGVSIILERQVMLIQKLIKENKEGKEIQQILNNKNQDYDCYILSKSWDNLIRSGRITKLKGFFAKTLKFNFVIKVQNEKLVFDSKHRSLLAALKYILTNLKVHQVKEIDVAYGFIEENILKKMKKIISEYDFKINLYSKLPKIIMCNTGVKTLAFGVWKNEL